MVFKVNPNRNVTINHVLKDEEGNEGTFSLHLRFKNSEELDYTEYRKRMEYSQGTHTVKDEEGNEEEVEEGAYNAFLYTLRTSIIGAEPIADLDGNPLKIIDEEGNVNEENQKAVFEFVKSIPELYDKMITAYQGHLGKNYKTGATQ